MSKIGEHYEPYTPETAAAWLEDLMCDEANQLRALAAEGACDAERRSYLLRRAQYHDGIARAVCDVSADVMRMFAAALNRAGDYAVKACVLIDCWEPTTAREFCRQFIVQTACEKEDGLRDATFNAAFDVVCAHLETEAAKVR